MEVIYEDAVCLSFHLDIMNESVKSNFIETMGYMKGMSLYRVYKKINKKTEKAILKEGEDVDINKMIALELSDDETSMLKEFLVSHIKNIKEEHEKEQKQQKGILSRIDEHPALIPLQTILYTLKIKKHAEVSV